MALGALHGSCIIIFLVPNQAKGSLRMVKFLKGSQRRVKIGPTMLGVAGSALVDRCDLAVRTLDALNLFFYICVALQALICQAAT